MKIISLIIIASMCFSCKSAPKDKSMLMKHKGRIIQTYLLNYAKSHGEWPENLDQLEIDFQKYGIEKCRWSYIQPETQPETTNGIVLIRELNKHTKILIYKDGSSGIKNN